NRALTEAAQSRVAHIQGGREDLVDIVRETAPSDRKDVRERGDAYSFATIPTVENANIDEDIRYLLDRLSDASFEHVVVLDLTPPRRTSTPITTHRSRDAIWPSGTTARSSSLTGSFTRAPRFHRRRAFAFWTRVRR